MVLILASSSSRLKRILKYLGYNFDCISPNIDETNSSNLKPIDYVVDVSERKGSHVWNNNQGSHVISGDTIIDFKKEINSIFCDSWKSAENLIKKEDVNEWDLYRKLGISRKSLWERRQKYGIPRKKKS